MLKCLYGRVVTDTVKLHLKIEVLNVLGDMNTVKIHNVTTYKVLKVYYSKKKKQQQGKVKFK